MAKVKYRIMEHQPKGGQIGSHSCYVQAVVDNVITNKELATKVHQIGSISSVPEIKAIIELVAQVIVQEAMENNRIQLETGDGGMMVSIFPQCSGSISDKDVQANPEKYNGATVATAEMLTADMIQWSLGARIGSKISKQFALQKQAERVAYNANQQTADPEGGEQTGGTTTGGNQGGGTGGLTPSGGGNGGGDNSGGDDNGGSTVD
jgi:hypothetical protein